jgi:hypothetical protein
MNEWMNKQINKFIQNILNAGAWGFLQIQQYAVLQEIPKIFGMKIWNRNAAISVEYG